MQIKAITILNTRQNSKGEQEFVNAAFAVTSDNLPLAKSFHVIIDGQPTYTETGIGNYLRATANGVASAIRHSKQNGYKQTEEQIIEALIEDIKSSIKEEGDNWCKPGTIGAGPQDIKSN